MFPVLAVNDYTTGSISGQMPIFWDHVRLFCPIYIDCVCIYVCVGSVYVVYFGVWVESSSYATDSCKENSQSAVVNKGLSTDKLTRGQQDSDSWRNELVSIAEYEMWIGKMCAESEGQTQPLSLQLPLRVNKVVVQREVETVSGLGSFSLNSCICNII